ncbi:MAG: hypothetical protein WC867_06070 [Candidatus Pacearchaeota archaeon]|jgi:integrase
MKKDPYKSQEAWNSWKDRNSTGIKGISKINSELLMHYLNDMEKGFNVSLLSKKGGRSYIRLRSSRSKLQFLISSFEKRYEINNISKLSEEQLIEFFSDLRSGAIRKIDGGIYKSVRDFSKTFKAFWHWYQKISKKAGKEIPDITVYLDSSGTKPEWVYLSENQVRKLYDNAKFDYKVLIMFLFDSGIRAPTELVNVKVSDLYHEFKELNIREETSKTFGRRIKLMLCSELLKEYIKINNLKSDDFLFDISPPVTNQYLKHLAKRVLGDEKSLAGQKYSELTMYDFRHCSCCYWLPRYKSESALKFRFGWKESDKIHYYSEMLGMRDTINEDDMLVDITKTEIEKRLDVSSREKEVLIERVNTLELQMKQILVLVNQVGMKV